MANICVNNIPAGIDSSCFGFESPVKNIFITGTAVKFADVNTAKSLTDWTTPLIGGLTGYVPAGLANYEVNSEDATINTTAYGRKFVVKEGIPSAKFMLESSVNDFSELLQTLKGSQYRLFFLLENGNIKGTVNSSGEFMGYLATIHAITTGIPALDSPENGYPVEVFFDDYEEFRTSFVLQVPWNADREFQAAMPFGLSMQFIGSYDTGTGKQVVYVTSRGGTAYTGLTVDDVEFTDENVTSPACSSLTDNGDGTYDLILEKGSTPVALASGDYVQFRFNVATSGVTTAVSSKLNLFV